jgi:hypothetical protein
MMVPPVIDSSAPVVSLEVTGLGSERIVNIPKCFAL